MRCSEVPILKKGVNFAKRIPNYSEIIIGMKLISFKLFSHLTSVLFILVDRCPKRKYYSNIIVSSITVTPVYFFVGLHENLSLRMFLNVRWMRVFPHKLSCY